MELFEIIKPKKFITEAAFKFFFFLFLSTKISDMRLEIFSKDKVFLAVIIILIRDGRLYVDY